MTSRNVTAEPLDPRERFGLYVLCQCTACEGSGRTYSDIPVKGSDTRTRCPECRGEGRIRQELATCETPEAVGVALVTLAREGEWIDDEGKPCALGLLERGAGKDGAGRWLILPWLASPRNVSDAGKVLRGARRP